MEYNRCVIITAGLEDDFPNLDWFPEINPDDYIICADGGYRICKMAGKRPHVVIGDFDSLSEELVEELETLSIERVIYPKDKDDTDTFLCVGYALARGFDRFVLAGGIGGDFGHTMANVQTLSYLTDMGCEAEIVTGHERLIMAEGENARENGETIAAKPVTVRGKPGGRFSVLSYTERSSGVCIDNAKYELSDAVLTHSRPVGVSNEFTGDGRVVISVREGRLLIVL